MHPSEEAATSLTLARGDAPLILSIPHSGTEIPVDVEQRLRSPWLARKDADWWVHLLYDFARELDVTVVRTAISRTVIDVNRDPSGQSLYPGKATTELCPTTTFDGEPLYQEASAPNAAEIAARRARWFDPFHRAIAAEVERLKNRRPAIVLYDAHSIRSVVPRLFDGTLPHLNIGTNSGASCAPELTEAVESACAASTFSRVTNGRFKGGYTTRHYGQPATGVHAIQMELACRGYLREPFEGYTPESWPAPYDRKHAAPMRRVLVEVLKACIRFASSRRERHLLPTLAALVLLVPQVGGCSRQDATHEAAELPVLGRYRATLSLPGGELPFGLELGRERDRYIAYLVNGAQRIAVPEVRVAGGRIEMSMPGYMNRLSARIDGTMLKGEVVLVKHGAKEQAIPFSAQHGPGHRFWSEPLAQSADLAGRWAVAFTDQDGESSLAIGELTQRDHEVVGTFVTSTSDYGYLAGEVHGQDFALSSFNGAWAFLFRGRVDERGEIEGTHWSGLDWRETFTGRRDANASFANTDFTTPTRAASARLDFAFPDLDGRPVSLGDPRFAGKVVIVALAGSWCPSCHDEAAFLASYHAKYRGRGVEVISLMFEHFGDFERAAEAVRRFRERYGLEYTMLIAGTSDEDSLAKRLPQLEGVHAVPATAFIDRQGRVRAIHAGFSGPATGEHHRRLVQRFEALTEALLAEP